MIDWECVSILPSWKVCQMPTFLKGCDRFEEPTRGNYSSTFDCDEDNKEVTDKLDNEGVDQFYWDHLLEYEQTKLRHVFVEHLREIEPAWVSEFEGGE